MTIVRDTFVGKRFFEGDAVDIKNFDYYRDAPFVYKDLSPNDFMTVTGKIHWKCDVTGIVANSKWSKFWWRFLQ